MKFKKNIIKIAVDGFSSCGKSTLAKDLAAELGFIYIDSGAMYRAITLYSIRKGFFEDQNLNSVELIRSLNQVNIDFLTDENSNLITLLNGENVESDIRSLSVSSKVSIISSVPEVRKKMVELQRQMSSKKSVVMDGRDIGTVVFPDADIKFFVTADIETRAKRRFLELVEKGQNPNFEEVKKNLTERDFLDQNRKDSPLVKAPDAILIDNTNLNRKEQLELALYYITKTLC
ncbi:MAG TPA: (d)CMP kinase [Bacteroidales bacterium]|jgi:cytidylate kinase|nr:(d)CMP kinase [Bacteroidales bacterium]HOL97252.1 (d)CMP kinase [Bacteroidales bacterium]HOM35544.1 (d)CMP kinase [Bacteroidales bacterium]HPD23835.1 (d)CMP kinase [Bacteroidales bacterium]HRS98759.1 (d)CMP kinase [Bacteroidales bacterium]